ncbi:hypothetical protein [Nocardioides piscis]|uniref:hypothetical protein n=1 Tax=Nocardioides piscis TaxID=2714938 RepID=UPI001FE4DDAF|nr:hypothetical protein [Nocardioides piscis]
MRDVEVAAVVVTLRRRCAGVVDTQDAVGDEPGIEAIGDGIGRQGSEEDPQRRDLLPRERARTAQQIAPTIATADQTAIDFGVIRELLVGPGGGGRTSTGWPWRVLLLRGRAPAGRDP